MAIIEMRPKGTFLYDGFYEFCNFLKHQNCKKILEIGSYIGESMRIFKEVLGDDVQVICIDPFMGMPDNNDLLQNTDFNEVETVFNANTLEVNNYGKLKFKSQDIANMFSNGYFDCIYIDGLHTYEQVKRDIEQYRPKLRSDGVLAGHDYDIKYVTDKQLSEMLDVEKTMQ